jgi:hypothetical protein
MPPNGRTLTVYLAADTKKAQQQLSGFQKTMKTLGKVGAVAAAAGVAVLTKKLVDLGRESLDLASNLEEVNNKINAVFGEESAQDLDAWAKSAADAFNMSEVAAKKAAADYAVFGKEAGLAGADLTDFSKNLVELAADMSSFNDVSMDRSLDAIRSALAGSSEPMLQFGVNTQVAALKAQALKDGLLEEGEAIDATNKTLIVYNQLMKKTVDQQGDVERSAGSLVYAQNKLAAKTENLKTEIGTALLPALTTLATVFAEDVLPAIEAFWQEIDEDVMAAITQFSNWLKGEGRLALQKFLDGIQNDLLPAMREAAGYIDESMTIYNEFAGSLSAIATALGAGNEEGTVPWMTRLVQVVIKLDELLNPIRQVLPAITTAFNNLAKAADNLEAKMRRTEAAIRGVINAAAGLVGLDGFGQVGAPGGGGSWSPRSSTVNVTVNAGVGDPVEIARTVKRVLGDANANLGVAW